MCRMPPARRRREKDRPMQSRTSVHSRSSALPQRFLCCLFSPAMAYGQNPAPDQAAPSVDPPGRVARIAYIQGNVSLEPAGVDSFSQAELNYPLTAGDRIYADIQALAEVQTSDLTVRMSNRCRRDHRLVDRPDRPDRPGAGQHPRQHARPHHPRRRRRNCRNRHTQRQHHRATAGRYPRRLLPAKRFHCRHRNHRPGDDHRTELRSGARPESIAAAYRAESESTRSRWDCSHPTTWTASTRIANRRRRAQSRRNPAT